MTSIVQEIPLAKLISSKANVRRTGRTDRIEELAASIESHGLLQNLTVRDNGEGLFEVIAGGRRLHALRLLAKRKVWASDAPVPCRIEEGDNVTEISLAENVTQAGMHPADQFEAFAKLREDGMEVADIAARFGVSPAIVTQRLKLAAVSKKLMKVYRAGEMSLDQLSAFAITDDTKKQERVWTSLGRDKSRAAILRALSEGQVESDDRRVVFVGIEAYEGAGGAMVRDLFDPEGGGFLTDADLLNRLVSEKLTGIADTVQAEGWKWMQAEAELDYSQQAGMRRIYPEAQPLTDEAQAQVDALNEKLNALCDDSEDAPSADIEAEIARIEAEVAALEGDEVFDADTVKIAGAFVSLGRDGKARVERGFIKAEDDTARQDAGAGEAKPVRDKDALPDSLKVELSIYRTAALANELAQKPEVALLAIIHSLAAEAFFPHDHEVSALTLSFSAPHLAAAGENRAVTEREARHEAWKKRMPKKAGKLWDFVAELPEAERLELLAHCASLSVDAVVAPKGEGSAAAAGLAKEVGLDMAAYWQPTAEGYFGRVNKSRILKDVRQAASPEDAQTCESLKKADMALRAEKLVSGKGWLPEQLR